MRKKYCSNFMNLLKIKYRLYTKTYKAFFGDIIKTKKTSVRLFMIVNKRKTRNKIRNLKTYFIQSAKTIKKCIRVSINLHKDKIRDMTKVRSLLMV
ncbi:MAG: hypothetical protein R3Y12_00640 [Clostridia bacterium]